MDRYSMSASNGSVVPHESKNGQWVMLEDVKELEAKLAEKESQALQWAKIAGQNQAQVSKLADEIEDVWKIKVAELKATVTRTYNLGCNCRYDDNGEVISWCCVHREWKDRAEEAEAELITLRLDNESKDMVIKGLESTNSALNDVITADEKIIEELEARLKQAEARLKEVYEIYAGMEGFIPETAPEGYCLSIIKKMATAAKE